MRRFLWEPDVMPTRPCRYCKNPVALSAKRCPSCDGKDPFPFDRDERLSGWVVVSVIVAAVVIWKLFAPSDTPDTDRAEDPQGQHQPAGEDTAPSWYQGSQPWSEISVEGRQEILNMRAAYETYQERAAEQADEQVDPALAQAGEALIRSICDKYRLDSYYKQPHLFGPRTVIWLPEAAWSDLSDTQKLSVSAYMSGRYKNWGIGVGRVSGVDVLADRLVVEH